MLCLDPSPLLPLSTRVATVCAVSLWVCNALWAAPIYRCGDVYTNQPNDPSANCQALQGGQFRLPAGSISSPPLSSNQRLPNAATPQSRPSADERTGVLALLNAELSLARQRLRASELGSDAHLRARGDIESLQREISRWTRRKTP